MKKLAVTFLSLLILAGFVSPVVSQSPETETVPTAQFTDLAKQAQADYQLVFDEYRDSHLAYIQAKGVWRTTPTLTNEQTALNAAKTAAINRARVLSAYTAWIRYQLLALAPFHDRAATVAEQLTNQINQLASHQNAISATSNTAQFNTLMAEYTLSVENGDQDRLYAVAQTELKLANLSYFQHRARALYDPILRNLEETKPEVPVVRDGLTRIPQLADQINSSINQLSQSTGSMEAGSYSSTSYFRRSNESLSYTHALQMNLMNLIVELETYNE